MLTSVHTCIDLIGDYCQTFEGEFTLAYSKADLLWTAKVDSRAGQVSATSHNKLVAIANLANELNS